MNNTQKIMYRIVLFVHIQRTNCMLKSIQLPTQKTHTILYTLTDQTKTTFSAKSASLFNPLNNADTQKGYLDPLSTYDIFPQGMTLLGTQEKPIFTCFILGH